MNQHVSALTKKVFKGFPVLLITMVSPKHLVYLLRRGKHSEQRISSFLQLHSKQQITVDPSQVKQISVVEFLEKIFTLTGWAVTEPGRPPESVICLSKMLIASGGRTRISISHLGEISDWLSSPHRALSMVYIMPSNVDHVKGKTPEKSFPHTQNVASHLYFRHSANSSYQSELCKVKLQE